MSPEQHDHDANGVCGRCQYINHDTYDLVLALVSANDVHIETNAVLSNRTAGHPVPRSSR